MRSSVVYLGIMILISATFSSNLACGEIPTDAGEHVSERKLALSLLSGMKARWDNEGSFDCKLEIAESELARETLLIPLGSEEMRIAFDSGSQTCAFGTIRKLWEFTDALEGNLDGRVDPRFTVVDKLETRAFLFAGNGFRLSRSGSFNESMKIALVPNFYALTSGRFPNALRDSISEMATIELRALQANRWHVSLAADGSEYRIEAEADFDRSIERRAWTVNAQHLYCTSFKHLHKPVGNKEFFEMYSHEVTWLPNDSGEFFPDFLSAKLFRVRKRADLDPDKHYASTGEFTCKFSWGKGPNSSQEERSTVPTQMVVNVSELKTFIMSDF